jgi:hypothetical protein
MALRASPKRRLKASLVRVVVRARRAQRRFLPGCRPGHLSAPPSTPAVVVPASSPDPIELVVLAIERLAPASFRSATLGQAVEVAVPDAETAAVFRAALARTSPRRSTDRLLSIVIGGKPA